MSEIRRLETEYTAASMLDGISEAKIAKFLHGIAGNMESLSREALKDFLSNVIGQVTLDPATHECQIDYCIGINLGDKMASPRGAVSHPVLEIIQHGRCDLTGLRAYHLFTD